MHGYEISSLSKNTQDLIKSQNVDINADGLINEDNGELADLLSKTGKNNIDELCYDSWFDAKKEDFIVGTIFLGGGTHFLNTAYKLRPCIQLRDLKSEAKDLYTKYNGVKPQPLSLDVPRSIAKVNDKALEEMKKYDEKIVDFIQAEQLELQAKFDNNRMNEIERRKAWNQKCAEWKPKVPMKECLKQGLKKLKKGNRLFKLPISTALGLLGLGGFALAAYLFTSKPGKGFAKFTGENDYIPVERQRSPIEEQFQQVFGEDAVLKEYTPRKGEYWISILKAKYGVDDATAQRMSHKIKDVIYEDSLAAKQSPVMYLPQTWEFEGKVYQYSDSAKVGKTEKYSDDVKTEMGKMGKDITY